MSLCSVRGHKIGGGRLPQPTSDDRAHHLRPVQQAIAVIDLVRPVVADRQAAVRRRLGPRGLRSTDADHTRTIDAVPERSTQQQAVSCAFDRVHEDQSPADVGGRGGRSREVGNSAQVETTLT